MTVFSGADAIRAFLAEFDGWISASVDVYLLGGSAMTIRGLKDQTEDIDVAFGVAAEFDHVSAVLEAQGFEVVAEPTAQFEGVGTTVEYRQPARGLHVDVFDRQVVGKVRITEQMRDRAAQFWEGERVTAFVLADEDLFLLKAVSGGDVGLGRRRDIEDMRIFAQRGLDYDIVLEEIERQRPFNTGAIEARHIRDRSHPLFAIDRAVTLLSGLPTDFTHRITALGTEFEIEYFVVQAVDEGIHDVARIRERVLSTVQALSGDDTEAVDRGIDRLIEKGILDRPDDTVSILH